MKYFFFISFLFAFTLKIQSQCKIIYVTPTGTGTGTKASPSSLANAVAIATKKDVIKLGNGTYNIDNPINLIDSITFEGGFLSASSWVKTSLVGTTIINRTTLNPEGVANAQRLVAFYGNNKSGFRFQDITITTANAIANGMSTYGVHLTNCSNYNFVRVQITSGNGSAGSNGGNGANGLIGSNGSSGGFGSCDGNYSCCFGTESAPGGNGGSGGQGASGVSGGASNANTTPINPGATGSGINGGGGGAGGKGGGFSGGNTAINGNNGGGSASLGLNTSVGIAGAQGNPGVNGTNGGNGSVGAPGVTGLVGVGSHSGGFWVPTSGTNGTNGSGGQGGAGGGGGGRQTCATCDEGPGNGGSGGGGGGQAGTGGVGGFGGGSSFAVYLFNNGVNSNFIQCALVSGTGGTGGTGGNGGIGGNGGNGAIGITNCSSEIGSGGAGGNGGKGGNGGNGGNGSTGISVNLHLNGGTAPSTSVISFNLAGLPEIKFDHQICANSASSFTAATSSTWVFGAIASPTSAVGTVVTTTYQTTGWNDVTFNSNVYSGFVYISPFSVSNSNAGSNQNVCATTATLNGNVPTYGSGTWTSLGTASVTTSSLSNSTVTGLVSGSNKFVWTVSNGGCCASSSSTVDLIYTPISVSVNSGVICSGQTFTIVPSGASTYSYSSGSNTVSPTSNTDYTVTGTSVGGCTNTAISSVTVNAIPLLTISPSTSSICSGVTITLTPSGAVNYSLNPGGLSSTSVFTVSPTSTTQYTLTGNDGLCSATIFPVTNVSVTSSSISPTITKTDVLCHGNSTGSLTVSVSGGPYTYSLFPGGSATTPTISGLAAGNYSVVVSNSCSSATVSANITEPLSALATTTAVTNVLCNGGTTGAATVTASGGTSGYTYLWSTSATTSVIIGQTAGVKTVTVTDANGCIATNYVTITEPLSALATTTAVSNILCNGGSTGSATVTVSGGTSGYTYLWSTAATTSVITGQTAGVKTVTVTDANGCTATNSVTITEPLSALATTTAVTNVLCNGGATGSATITVSGGTTPYSYMASNGYTTSTLPGLVAGTYNYTVTDGNGCTKTQGLTITQPSALSTTSAVTNILCNGGSTGSATVTVSGGTSGYTYLWSTAATTSVITGQTAGIKTVTVTDANGCTATNSVTITEPLSALATTTSVTNILCNGGSTGAATVTVSGGTSGYTYLWSTAATTSVITGQTAGVKTVTVTDANGCTATNSVTITEPLTALATTTTVTNILCNGGTTGSATVTASGGTSGYTYLWSTAATTSVITGQTAGIKTVTVTDANGCPATNSVTITEPLSALATTTAVTNVQCNGGSTGSATVTVSGGTTPYSYMASNGYTTPTLPGLVAGIYNYTVTDGNGCTATNSVTITEPLSALVTTAAVTNVQCNGGSTGSATVTVSGGTTPYSYMASNGYTTSTLPGLVAGTYNYTVTDGNGCTATNTVTITEPLSALITTTAVTNVQCNGGSTGSATVTVSGGTSGYTYLWSTSATTSVITGQTAGVKTVTVTDANGCTATNSVTITEPNVLTLSSSSSAITCNGGVSSISITASGGMAPYTGVGTFTMMAGTSSFSVTDNNNCVSSITVSVSEPSAISSVQSITLCTGQSVTVGSNTYSISGTYIDILVSSVNGCDSIVTTDLLINGLPNVTVNSGTICSGSSFTMNPSGAISYTYSNGSSIDTPTANTTYTVTGVDVNGCLNTATSSVIVNSLPVISVNSGTVCSGSSFTMNPSGATTYTFSNGSSIDIPTANTVYTVTGMDGNSCVNTVTCSVVVNSLPILTVNSGTICSGASFTMNPSGAITYSYSNGSAVDFPITNTSYTVTGTDINGCTNSVISSVIVNNLPNVSISGNLSVCNGSTVTLTGNGALTYTWSNNANTNTINVSPTSNTSYSVIGVDGNNCSNTSIVTVSVGVLPVISISSGSICSGQSYVLNPLGATTYSYSSGSNTITPLSTNIYTITGTNSQGCVGSATVIITVNQTPTVTAGANFEVNKDETFQLNGLVIGASTYTWLPSGLNNANTLNASGLANATTEYTLIVSSSAGCIAQSTVLVTVIDTDFIISNYISPNGDQENDTWKISNLNQIKKYAISITDQWGNIVFSVDNGYNNNWDGTKNGKALSDGVYYYLITDQGNVKYSGSITLLH